MITTKPLYGPISSRTYCIAIAYCIILQAFELINKELIILQRNYN